ncbi:MAG TPA: ATP-binding cassette domain-containing protein [Firmicutes bacterium]|jgi:NitT/TauT family transport system ATP-binding protein|nr:ATP-binding cassette domain-containing protein [Bacillota bacterium]
MIKLTNLSKRFPTVQVLDSLSLELPERGIIAFMGPSGSGKTTLFRLISGLLPPDSGSVEAPERCSFVFQEDRLLPWSSVQENIEIVLDRQQQRAGVARRLLVELGLGGTENQSIQELSGGMRRRVAIGRALAYDAPLLLMDEPFKGLDSATKRQVMDIIALQASERLILLSTHDPLEALYLADELYLFDGPPLKVKRHIVISEARSTRRGDPDFRVRYQEVVQNV